MSSKERILIVDDDASTRRMLSLIFDEVGYETETASTGQEAIAKTRSRRFDLALLDIRLPDIEGVDLLPPLKDACPDLALMFVTGHASLKTAIRALNLGAAAYITKPLDMDQVLSRVRDVLDRQRLVVEKQQAEEAVRKSESRYRTLFENVPISLWEEDFSAVKSFIDKIKEQGHVDLREFFERNPEAVAHCAASARILDVNNATLELYDASSKQELIGALDRVFGPEAYPVFKEELIALSEGQSEFSAEIINRTLSGRSIYVSLNMSVAPGSAENWSKILLSITDITQRVRAENEVRRRNREMALLNRVITAATSTLDVNHVLDVTCQELAQTFVLPRAEALLLNADGTEGIVVAAYAAASSQTRLGETISIAGSPAAELILKHNTHTAFLDVQTDGRLVSAHDLLLNYGTVSLLTVPIVLASGQVVGVLWLHSNVRREFSAEEIDLVSHVAAAAGQALETGRLYQALRRNVGKLEQTVAQRTAELQAQYARLEAILRSTTDGIIVADGQGEIIHTNPVARAWLTRDLSHQDAIQLREVVRGLVQRANERPETVIELTGLDLQLNAAPIAEPEITEGRAVVAVHDVTHLKELDRMKSRFVSHVSHELRTPITTVMLYLALMRRNPEKSEQYLDIVEQEAKRQGKLIEDILQLSRIDAGRLEIEPRPTSLNALAESALSGHWPLAQNQGLLLERRLAEPEPVALVDPDRMVQVVNNLLLNAIRYSTEGGRIEVSTGVGPAAGQRWATITVKDTGIGIPKNELPHIFDRFFRGEAPQQMQIKGTGLGLAISKEIVEMHRGKVTVISQVGVGTTFTVWLPLAE